MIKGIESNSENVQPGFAFVAIRGLKHDGHNFISQAVKKGATWIVGEKTRPSWLAKSVKYTKVKDSQEALGNLASKFYKNPSNKLKVIGVTGTKGKTTTAHLIYHILTKLGKKVGLISSISVPGLHVTTPDVITLHKMLKDMLDEGCEYAVVEVSSHGIDQKRIAGIKFEVGVLTNIAPEHLDYHKSLGQYKKVKMSFVKLAKIRVVSPKSTKLNVLPGKFNNLNAQTAVDVAGKLGFDKKKAIEALKSFKLPQGRLEEIKNDRGIRIFVDFAHTPDSLKAALTYLKSITKGKLISVFGCAGERDSKKRSKMGKISTQIADFSVFTAEDPRSEEIFSILSQIEKGIVNKKFASIPERGEAISYALSLARKGDIVGIFGKGHEKSMAYKGFEHPWSDKEMITGILQANKDEAVIVLAAGKGTRMKSKNPKVLHTICGRPMIAYTLENLRKAGFAEVIVVVSFKKALVLKEVGKACKIAVQKNPKGGTADAAKAGLGSLSKNISTVAVINGDDSAFYKPETIRDILRFHKKSSSVLTFVSLVKDDPYGLGRVVRDGKGDVVRIVEEKNATDAQKKIKEVNDGLYVFKRDWLDKNINKVKLSPQGEYYLVDLIKIAIDRGEKVGVYRLKDASQWQGINTPEQLALAQDKMKQRLVGYE